MPCILQSERLAEIIGLLHRLLKIRITFFDMRQEELSGIGSGEMCDFCLLSRRQPAFDERCRQCDENHLVAAKRDRALQIYHCHAGLLEGIVPLYTLRDEYLGAIVFGQALDADAPTSPREASGGMRVSDKCEMEMIGELLKYLGEYICDHELISCQREHWVDVLEKHFDHHLDEKISMKELAALTGYSASFLSHNFLRAFGMPMKKYIRRKRMRKARRMLAAGKLVRECAFALGYADEYYFSREFKKFFGYPPKTVLRKEPPRGA